jgi:hypothetical protein
MHTALRAPADLLALARLEEARLAQGFRETSSESAPFAGGIMCRDVPGLWCNAAVGGGMHGSVKGDDIDHLIAFHSERGIEPRAEVCPMSDLSLTTGLSSRGFVVRNYETVFFRPVDEPTIPDWRAIAPPGLHIEPVPKTDPAAMEEFAYVAVHGFMPPGVEPSRDLLDSALRSGRAPRCTPLRAVLDGRCVGAGAMDLLGEVAALYGVSVRSEVRGKGVQLALLAWRIAHAAKLGVRWVTISSRPGGITERNAQRMGFQVAYTKVILARPGPGLAPVQE